MTTKSELLQILLDAWTQFSWRSYVGSEPHLHDGGLKSLEEIRAVLVEHRMIHRKTGLPPDYPTDETGGFQRRQLKRASMAGGKYGGMGKSKRSTKGGRTK